MGLTLVIRSDRELPPFSISNREFERPQFRIRVQSQKFQLIWELCFSKITVKIIVSVLLCAVRGCYGGPLLPGLTFRRFRLPQRPERGANIRYAIYPTKR